MVAVSVLVIGATVSCRDQSYPVPPIRDMQAEEARAVERQNVRRFPGLGEIPAVPGAPADPNAYMEFVKVMNSTTPVQAGEFESQVKHDPEALDAREKLLYFYSNHLPSTPIFVYSKNSPMYVSGPPVENARALRRAHLLWMIRNHPEHRALQNGAAIPNPSPSAPDADPETYAEAKPLWLEHVGSSNPEVLRNAALFFEPTDKGQAEQLLLRAQAIHPDREWTIRLGRLYGFALMGVTDKIWGSFGLPLIGGRVEATSETEAQSAYTHTVEMKLDNSSDAQLLNVVGQNLLGTFGPGSAFAKPTLAYKYFERAVQLDPQLVEAHIPLAQKRIRQSSPDTRAILQKTDREKKFEVISKLPASEQLVVLGEMSRSLYNQANSVEVTDGEASSKVGDRDWTSATRFQAKRYAEALLKLAPRFRSDPAYSGALFTSNVILATIGAQDSDMTAALGYLRDASRIPSSEEMAYLPPRVPYLILAKLIAEKGYRSDATAFLEHFATINVSDRDAALVAAAQLRVEAGR
jgi:hypothetical protein